MNNYEPIAGTPCNHKDPMENCPDMRDIRALRVEIQAIYVRLDEAMKERGDLIKRLIRLEQIVEVIDERRGGRREG